MKFQVTQEDIDKGFRLNSGKCPVANCLRRTLEKNFMVTSFSATEYRDDGGYSIILIPKIVGDFIRSFDKGIAVQPIEFESSIVEG